MPAPPHDRPPDRLDEGDTRVNIDIGQTLREAREEQGRTIEDAARDTRVRGDYLRALEAEEFGVFGGDVYAKGFLLTYARYLQIDPQPLLETYRRNVQHDDYDPAALAATPVTRQPSPPPPTWVAWVVVVIIVMIGVAALAQVFGGRTPEPAQERPPQPAASQTATPAPTETATPSPSPSPSPTYEGVNLILTFEDASWMRVIVDGQKVFEDVVPRGETVTYQGQDTISIRFGNAAGVRVELNGQDLGPQGARGEVKTVTFTPEGAQPA